MTSAAESRPAEFAPAGVWLGFAMMCIGMFMAVLDVQVVATSLPTIQEALGIGQDQMSWVQTAYLIAEIISIPLTGLLTRALTMRVLFAVALSVFTLASIGCAASSTLGFLILSRVVQGFFGGALIPMVFAAIFLLFPARLQPLATVTAGTLAVLAPTLGPVVGGWITSTYSWPWLFLINVVPGIVAGAIAWLSLPKGRPSLQLLRHTDLIALAVGAIALAAFEIAVKEAPKHGWTSLLVASLLGAFLVLGALFAWRTLRAETPVIDLRTFKDRNFAVGCLLSFVLGMCLYGSVYLMPVFLAYVRGHDALEIGKIMLVTGLAQLIATPVAAGLVRRRDDRLLSALGFLILAIGLYLSSDQTRATDSDEMFWPQVVRGAAIMFCILPPTEIALGQLAREAIPDASGLFNMMRNLGGAIGIAVIDTVIYSRAPNYAQDLTHRLMNGDLSMAGTLGISPQSLQDALVDPGQRAMLVKLVNEVSFTHAVNDAWRLLALLTTAAILVVPLARRMVITDAGISGGRSKQIARRH